MTNTAGNTIPATSTSLGSDATRFDWQAFGTKFRDAQKPQRQSLSNRSARQLPNFNLAKKAVPMTLDPKRSEETR
jgi:hypothetical protein